MGTFLMVSVIVSVILASMGLGLLAIMALVNVIARFMPK